MCYQSVPLIFLSSVCQVVAESTIVVTNGEEIGCVYYRALDLVHSYLVH